MEQGTIAAVQFEPVPGDVDANLGTIDDSLSGVAADTQLAVFPEMAVTGYDLEVAEREATPVPGAVTERLVDLAEAHGTDIAVGLPERVQGTLYNDLVYVSETGVSARYRKRKLWGEEAEVFDHSHDPVVVESDLGSVGMLVCYDLNFPELALEYAEEAVDLIAVSSAWRTDFLADWELLLRARALDSTSYVIGSNHVGDQHGRDHAGHSMIVGPDGSVLERAGTERESISTEMTADAIEAARDRNPVLADRRR